MLECPVNELVDYGRSYLKNKVNNLEGKLGLVVYVERNKLLQPVGYTVLLEGRKMLFKSLVAEKYFELVETNNNESGGFS